MLSNKKSHLLVGIIVVVILGAYFFNLKVIAKDDFSIEEEQVAGLQVVEYTTLLPIASPPSPIVAQRVEVIVTAYSSTIWETDDTPFITASNKTVREGIVANNLLTFGTKVRLPGIFGDRVFEVQDRMHRRKSYYHVDIWFPSREAALEFGAQLATMEILAD